MKRAVAPGSPVSKKTLPLLALLAVTGMISLAWISENPAHPNSSESPFSAIRAITELKVFLGEQSPHLTGSIKNAKVLERIEKAVQDLGYRAERQAAFLCMSRFAGQFAIA